MDGREDEPGASEGPPDPDQGTTTGAATAPPGSGVEEDLSAETTRRVDTAGAARGDVRRPGTADPQSASSVPAPSAPTTSTTSSPNGPASGPYGPGQAAVGRATGQPTPTQPSHGQPTTEQATPGPEPSVPGGPGPSSPAETGAGTTPDDQHAPAPSSEIATIGPPSGPPALSDLSSAHLLRPAKPVPRTGWRRAVYVASGGAVNPGESEADAARRALVARVNQPLQGCYKIAMLSLKGGVGKTTTTAALGATFASLRGDRVVAVDANPDRGTLAEKVPVETTATVRHLLRDAALVRRYSDVRAYTSQGPSRLEVLASEQDPAVSEAFSELDYRRAVDLLEHFYNIVLTDCGTGLMHSAMRGVLDVADSLVVVSSSSIDGARSASATLDWLDAHGYGDLVARSTAVINYVRRSSGGVDLDRVAEHFAARCRTVARLPFDPHLDEGAEIELEKLAPRTRTAMLELAAVVADDFPRVGSRVRLGPR